MCTLQNTIYLSHFNQKKDVMSQINTINTINTTNTINFEDVYYNFKNSSNYYNWFFNSFWLYFGLSISGLLISQLLNIKNVCASGPTDTGGAPRVASVVKPDNFTAEGLFIYLLFCVFIKNNKLRFCVCVFVFVFVLCF